MLRSDFHFDLPPELIAQEPLPRGQSRLMVVRPGADPPFQHCSFSDFPSLLDADDVLVINDTRVFPARLFARPLRSMSNPIEVLLTRRLGGLRWSAWCRPARRVRSGDRLEFSARLAAIVESKSEGTITMQFEIDGQSQGGIAETAFWEEVEQIGVAPLPPYIRRSQPLPADRNSYQTVYANKRGAVAAPTAGLHFSEEILDQLKTKGVEVIAITLHVGAGTFSPVKVEDISDHVMESEEYEISESAAVRLNAARDSGKRVVAVGTTSVRTLESAFREGGSRIMAGRSSTSIFITPGFDFRVVDALVTNFHLPESTLLMLVSAFAGRETIRQAYDEAIRAGYRFYSYGDAMFIASRRK